MSKVRVYVDGFNLYHAIDRLDSSKLKWLNFWTLAESLLRKGEVLDEVNFFTAILTWNKEKQQRHVNYLRALRAVGVSVHEANFKRANKRCQAFERYCNFHEEKQTDVAIAVKIVDDALNKRASRIILITADSDQVPTAKFVAGLEGVSMSLVFPPGRAQEARDLGNHIPDRRELTEGRLGTCLLPRTVLNKQGRSVAFMPAAYVV